MTIEKKVKLQSIKNKKNKKVPGIVMYAFNLRTQEAEEGRYL